MKINHHVLLKYLLKHQTTSIDDGCKLLNVSTRTIRNYVAEINQNLVNFNITTSIFIKNNQIIFENTQEIRNQLLEKFNLTNCYTYHLSGFERTNLIILELLFSDKPITLQNLSDKLFVSKSTIAKDINSVEKSLNQIGVNLQRKKGLGYVVSLSEFERRSSIRRIISKTRNIYDHDFIVNPLLANYVERVDIEEIKRVLIACERKFSYLMTDASFEGLILHITLTVIRNRNQKLKLNDVPKFNSENRIEELMAKYICERLEKIFHLNLPDFEKYFITQHIFNRETVLKDFVNNNDWLFIQILTTDLISAVQREIQINLSQDAKLREGLIAHLVSTHYRIKNYHDIENPILNELRENYGVLFSVLKNNIDKVSGFLETPLKDDEIAYILIHFASAIERQTQYKDNVPDILIVCGAGLATGEYIAQKLQTRLNVNIIDIISSQRVQSENKFKNVDLVLTTVFLDSKISNLRISPILSEEDIHKIIFRLEHLGFNNVYRKTASKYQYALDSVIKVLNKHERYENIPIVLNEVREIIDNLGIENYQNKLKKGYEQQMLSQVLKEKYILINQVSDNWEDAVKLSGQILVENGIIEMSYVDAAIENVKKLGPYIVITKGVAIPHAPTESGVHQTAISLVVLKEGVNFGNNLNDPVKYIFMVCTTSPNAHLKALSELVDILSNKDFFKFIDRSTQAKQIHDYILEFESIKGKGGENSYEEGLSDVSHRYG